MAASDSDSNQTDHEADGNARPPVIRLNSSTSQAAVETPIPTPLQESGSEISPTDDNNASSESDHAQPAYGESYDKIDTDQGGLGTEAKLAPDGRINIRIDQKTKGLSSLLVPALRSQLDLAGVPASSAPPSIPPAFVGVDGQPPPPLNIVVHIVGSRGDVQPFVALGKLLTKQYNHRVRIATHPVFKDLVRENDLEFFSIGGDPSELMAFMVKNPGLMPGFDSMRNGDVGNRRKGIAEMVKGCWRSCVETGDGLGDALETKVEDWARPDDGSEQGHQPKPFIADAIIANPPSFAHIHCAEKLGVPLHMMFTMPWSPTRSFPHPLANIQSTNTDVDLTNFLSYALIDMLTWQGLGDVINRFRQKSLGLEPVSMTWAPGMLERLRIPYTYCWSPALIPKPVDWAPNITVSGFYFLSMSSDYEPDPELAAFLEAGPPPVYIGFGSIVVDDPDGMTRLIFDAVKQSGQRALVSKGWGGFGAEAIGIPEGVFMLGNIPHEWLFKRVSCVVHHGGAGTTAAGIAAGKPTAVVPFFGDQPFWGAMVARAGAGPNPIPYKDLSAESLATAILDCLKPEVQEKAQNLSSRISSEKGTENGAKSFHKSLDVNKLRCQLCPGRVAVWRMRRTDIRLSAFAATVLVHEGLLAWHDLKLYRAIEYETDDGPWDPITGGAAALIGTLTSMSMGVADMPIETLKALKIHPATRKASKSKSEHEDIPSDATSPNPQKQQNHVPEQSVTSPDLQSPGEGLKTDTGADGSESPLRKLSPGRLRSSSGASTSPSRSRGRSLSASKSDVGDLPPYSEPQITQSTVPNPRTTSPSRSTRMTSDSSPKTFSIPDAIGPALSTGKGLYRITGEGIKSPMEFTVAMAKGFHNAPKLYNDDTVRKHEKITGISSGLRAAGKEMGYGLYDGISGLVTQPLSGAKKEGAAGFFKGFGKGIGGFLFKPGAGFWAIPAYTSKGLYKELYKNYGTSLENYILASRTAQGYEEARLAGAEERAIVVQHWKQIRHYIRKKQSLANEHLQRIQDKYLERRNSQEPRDDGSKSQNSTYSMPQAQSNYVANMAQIQRASTIASLDSEVYSPEDSKLDPWPGAPYGSASEQAGDGESGRNTSTSVGHTEPPPEYTPTILASTSEKASSTAYAESKMDRNSESADSDIEAAIAASVRETSRGNNEEDAAIERAIRASLQELGNKKASGANDAEMQEAMQASIQRASQVGARSRLAETDRDDGEDDGDDSFDGVDIDDEELRRVLEESRTMEDERIAEEEKAKKEEEIVMQYIMKQSAAEEELRKKQTSSETN